jgi:hypothetical protein
MTAQPASALSTMSWDRRTLAAAALVALFVVVQFAVPAAALFGHRPARGGWQMYSAFPDVPSVWLIDAAGHETQVDATQFFAQLRAEIDFAAALRAGVCDASGAVAVKLSDSRGTTEVIECR